MGLGLFYFQVMIFCSAILAFWTMDDKVHCFFVWTSKEKSDTDADDSPLQGSGGVLFKGFDNSVLLVAKNDIGRDFLKFSLLLFLSFDVACYSTSSHNRNIKQVGYSLQYAVFEL